MAYELPSIGNLENVLNNLGQNNRMDAQTALANSRANQQLALETQANQRANDQFNFGVQQARQAQAIQTFGSAVQMRAKVNPNLQAALSGLIPSLAYDKTGQASAQVMALMNQNPDLMKAAQDEYSKLDSGTKQILGREYASLFGNASDIQNTTPSSPTGYSQADLTDYANKVAQSGINPEGMGTDRGQTNPYQDPNFLARQYGAAPGQGFYGNTPVPTLTPPPTPPSYAQQAQLMLKRLQLQNAAKAGLQLQPEDQNFLQNVQPQQLQGPQ